jgi:hypothetical protein
MKKILLCVLFLAVFANSAISQNSVIGNWTLEKQRKSSPAPVIFLEADTLKLTSEWTLKEISIYDINYPEYGPQKINLKYKLKITTEGEYRLDSELKKYPKGDKTTREVIEGSASDEDAAQGSIKEIEKLIKEEFKNFLPILNVSETELELQATNNNLKFTKPRSLPVSKLTRDTVPFFAPEGWRYPETAKELASFEKRLKNDPGNLFTIAKGDFDGNGYADAAAYLLNESTGQVALFVNMNFSDGADLNPYGNADKNTVIENGVMLYPPGEYVNSATKAKITIENPAFVVIIFDTAANLVYWNSRYKEWVSIPLGKKF